MATKEERRSAAEVSVDVAVIGAGTAGMAAYRQATREGKTAVLVERGPYGTTCARVGCMPSKLLVAAGEAAHHARKADVLGVHAAVTVDRRAVMERVRRERDRFVGFVLRSVEAFPAADRIQGHARFVGPHELDVDGAKVRARAFVIATGSSPFVPKMFDPIRDRIVVNDDVFSWEELPGSVAVFGAGIVGLELGQALHRLGVRVRVFGMGEDVGGLTDPVVKRAAADALRRELAIDFDAAVRAVEPDGSDVVVRFLDEEGAEWVERFDTALIAAGRRPNLADLGLESVGVPDDAEVDRATLRWGDTHLFIAGDATGELPVLHEAADEGRIAGDNAARYPDVRPGARRTPLAIVFSEPQLAIVAGGYAAVANEPHAAGEVSFEDQGRSRIIVQNHGAARVYAEPETRRFLGAEIAGPRAEHIGHLLAWAHQARMTIDDMLAMPFYHPVIEEGIRTALRDALRNLGGPVSVRVAGKRPQEL